MGDDIYVAEGSTLASAPQLPQNSSSILKRTAFAFDLEQLRTWARSGTLALLDQGLISGSNFVLGIALARLGGPEAYGAYMVMFSAFFLIANVYQALLIEPTVVLVYSLFPTNHGRYVRALLRLHAVFTLGFVLTVGTILIIAPHLKITNPLFYSLIGFLISTPCILLFWLARCFAYVEFSPGKALAGSLAYAGVLFSGLAISYLSGAITPLRVFLCSACAASAACVGLLFRYRQLEPIAAENPSLREVWTRHWKYGRWGLGGVGMLWAQTNSISLTSGYVLGLSGVGGLNALAGLTLPIGQVFSAASRITLPRIAHIYTVHGSQATHQPVIRVAVALTALTSVYWIAISLAHEPLFRSLYGDRFLPFTYLVPAMSFNCVPWAAITTFDIGFNAIQKPQSSFGLKVLMVAITVPLTTAMTWRFGLPGAALAIPACGLMTAVTMAFRLRDVWRKTEK